MCLSRTAINSWGSSALVMFSSTVLESWKSKQTYFGIMRWLLGTRLSCSVPVRGSGRDVRLWHKADVRTALTNVRFEENNGHDADVTRCLLMTQCGLRPRRWQERKAYPL